MIEQPQKMLSDVNIVVAWKTYAVDFNDNDDDVLHLNDRKNLPEKNL